MIDYDYAINPSEQVAGHSFLAGDVEKATFLYTGTPGADRQLIVEVK